MFVEIKIFRMSFPLKLFIKCNRERERESSLGQKNFKKQSFLYLIVWSKSNSSPWHWNSWFHSVPGIYKNPVSLSLVMSIQQIYIINCDCSRKICCAFDLQRFIKKVSNLKRNIILNELSFTLLDFLYSIRIKKDQRNHG